jgi:Putative peptidoglycan binding domain
MAVHVVQQGEHLSGIARQYGFRDYQTIWNHAQNAGLREQRPNPHVLYPGDNVYIPDKQARSASLATGQVHRFVLEGKRLKLRLAVQDWNGHPIKNTPCTLVVESQTYKLNTDADGIVSQEISPEARKGKLSIRDMELELLIGHLDPVDWISGWRARLNNLGYNAGDAEKEDDLKLRSAIEQFQHDSGLKRDGSCGPKTQAALLKAHGS